MIVVEDLCFDYPGKRALDHVSFTIAPNTITALVGANGAGKTTLLRCLAALESPMQGKITIDNWDTDNDPRKVHEVSSYLSDFFGLYDQLTVEQNLKFFAWSHDCERTKTSALVEEAAKRLDIWDHQNDLAGKLSRGLRQRLAIAQTIIHKPKILFLDEPASGLDPEARYKLSKLLLLLQKEGMTLIVSSHILAELEDYSTHMMILDEGKMVKQCLLSDYQRSHSTSLRVEMASDAQNYSDILKTIPNISVKSIDKNVVILDFKGSQNDQHELLKILIDKQIPVYSIQEQRQRMQEVYMDVAKDTKEQKKKREKEDEIKTEKDK